MSAAPAVDVCIVTHDSAADLPACLDGVAAFEHRPLNVVVVDSGSADGSVAAAEAARPALTLAGVGLRVDELGANLGFAAGMNRALALSAGEWALSLNADARPEPDYLNRLLACAGAAGGLRVGAVTGRLVRETPEPVDGRGRASSSGRGGGASRARDGAPRREAPPPVEGGEAGAADSAPGAGVAGGVVPLLDACGMRLTRSWRHLDRGSGEPDDGRFGHRERVFGATGAASLFRRSALADVALDGDAFDPLFHSFREDAELAFRLRERGWEVLYEPAALAVHRRWNLPARRRAMPPEVNRHSLKNRYLLRLYHQTAGNFLRTLPWALARDLGALAYALLFERSSLPAYAWLWRHRREIAARRRTIQGRRTVPPGEVDRWFGRSGMPL